MLSKAEIEAELTARGVDVGSLGQETAKEAPTQDLATLVQAPLREELAQPGPDPKASVLPILTSVAASAIPGGKIAQTIYQMLAGYGSHKANQALGLEGEGGDVMSAVAPAVPMVGGTLYNSLKGTMQRGANSALRYRSPSQQAIDKTNLETQWGQQKAEIAGDYANAQAAHAQDEAIRKADLGEQWRQEKGRVYGDYEQAKAAHDQSEAIRRTDLTTELDRANAAQTAEAKAAHEAALKQAKEQYAAQKASYEADKVAFGQQSLAEATRLVEADKPPQSASQIYAVLDKDTTSIKLTNLRASEAKYGRLTEQKAQALGFQPNPALERINPAVDAPQNTGYFQGILTKNQRDEALRNEVFELTQYWEKTGNRIPLDQYRQLKTQVAQKEAAMATSPAVPANILMADIQETGRLIGQARRANNPQLEYNLRQHLAAMYDDLAQAEGLSNEFKFAQSLKRREFADEDAKDIIRTSTRDVQLPGEPYTVVLDIPAYLKKLRNFRATDRLFEGSYPKGYLDQWDSTMRELGEQAPKRPTRPTMPQYAAPASIEASFLAQAGPQPPELMQAPQPIPQPGPQAPSPMMPPQMLKTPEKGGAMLKIFISSIGGSLAYTAGKQLGMPGWHSFGAGAAVAGMQAENILNRIAQSPKMQKALVRISKAGDGRIALESLQQLATLADAERAQANPPKDEELTLLPPAAQPVQQK